MSTTERLPLLPLDDTVVLPGMAVPVELGDAEARVAVDAAGTQDGPVPRPADPAPERPLRRHRHDRRRRAGRPAARRRPRRADPRHRAGCGSAPGPPAPAARSGSSVTELPDDGLGERAQELAREYKALATVWLQQRGAWQVIDRVQRLDDPSALADTAGYAAYLAADQKLTLLETADVGPPAGARDPLGPRAPRRAGRRRDDRQGRPGGHRQAAARVPAAPAARRRPQGAARAERRRGRRGRARRPARPRRGRRPARERPRGRAQGGRQAGAHRPTSPRRPPGSGPGWTPSWSCRGTSAPRTPTTSRRPRGAGRRPRRPGGREGADHRVPGGAQAARGPRPGRRRRPAQRRRAGPGRAARRRQDLARRVRGAGDGPEVRPGRARRRPGRGRDPRPPAHLRRRAARPDRPGRSRRPGR